MSRLTEKRAERNARLMQQLLEIAALSEGVALEAMRHRGSKPAQARQLFYWLAMNTYGKQGWSEIGRFIGRDHATIINQHNVMEWRMQREPLLAARVHGLRRRIMCLGAEQALIEMRDAQAIAAAGKDVKDVEDGLGPTWYEANARGRHGDGESYRIPSCRAQNMRFAAHWRATVGEARWP